MILNSFLGCSEPEIDEEFYLYYKKQEEIQVKKDEEQEKKEQDQGMNENTHHETQLINHMEQQTEVQNQEFEENNSNILQSNSKSQEKIQTSENTNQSNNIEHQNLKKYILVEQEGLESVRRIFPKIMNLININDFRTFFHSITPASIKSAYPKYFFILSKLWIREPWINKMLDYKFDNKDKNWVDNCDFHQPIKNQKYGIYSHENLMKVNGLDQCTKDDVLQSKLGEFHILCKKYKIVDQIDRFMTFQKFRSAIDQIKQQCKEEGIADSDFLTHIKALQEFAIIIEQLKQNTVRQTKQQPKMKKTIDILVQDIQELFQIPEIHLQQYIIQAHIKDVINEDNIRQDDKNKWTDFQKLVDTIFQKDSKRETKKQQKQVKSDQKFSQADSYLNEQFVNACLDGNSVSHSINSIDY
ncbi:unnamed protein product (macronuclear) [Paramecium tetraurelia]|uniref:Uncharacterized protein n=1 Tax=Paramecium tetraurelia TaxID=5888 RepID=A0BYA0_PARTE|nr:uncharacterized protein GSPATT00033370001 [Paramecium tetraurelia]CAK63517.1 unnamed protein product [Paramecium tetraurelia]|eukprot:XP_001430915.1 hypothetical protein (macronuclear) [Paramecium tetraurelia strain d4-2]